MSNCGLKLRDRPCVPQGYRKLDSACPRDKLTFSSYCMPVKTRYWAIYFLDPSRLEFVICKSHGLFHDI